MLAYVLSYVVERTNVVRNSVAVIENSMTSLTDVIIAIDNLRIF